MNNAMTDRSRERVESLLDPEYGIRRRDWRTSVAAEARAAGPREEETQRRRLALYVLADCRDQRGHRSCRMERRQACLDACPGCRFSGIRDKCTSDN